MIAPSDALKLPCGAILKNRFAKSAMTEGVASAENRATPEHATLYGRWARGGAGLLITGNVLVDRRFLERPANVAIDKNGGLRELAAWAAAGRENGTHIWMQINHPGRQAGTGTEKFVSASENTKPGKEGLTRALDAAEIEDIIARFVHCAKVAQDTGFTGVQVHAAHGYLVSQFLSPLTNRREDAWGGTLESRARLLLQIVRGVRSAVGGAFPVSVKLNSADFQKGGFTEDESLQVIEWLEAEGIDLLEISGGNYESQSMAGRDEALQLKAKQKTASTIDREAYFLEFAAKIQPRVKVPLMVTGGFRNRPVIESALASRELDVVGLARPLCYNPNYCNMMLSGETDQLWSPGEEFSLHHDEAARMGEMDRRVLEIVVATAYYFNQIRLLAAGAETEADFSWQEQIERNTALEADAEARYQASMT